MTFKAEKNKRVGKFIAYISRIQVAYIAKKLGHLGLGRGTYPLILGLAKSEGISQNSLARSVQLDKAMVARNIKKLVELGYVERRQHPTKKSCILLSLTEKGKEALPIIGSAIQEMHNYITQDIDDINRLREDLILMEKRALELANND